MKKRVIVYDLHNKGSNDYSDLYSVLNELNAKMLNESAYLIESNLSQREIENKIKPTIKNDDNVYFVSVDFSNNLFCKKI